MNMAWMRALALGAVVCVGAPVVTNLAQDKQEGETAKEGEAKIESPKTWKEATDAIQKYAQSFGRRPNSEENEKIWEFAWKTVADYTTNHADAEDVKEAYAWASMRAGQGMKKDVFLNIAKAYLKKYPEGEEARSFRMNFILGGKENESFKKEAAEELRKLNAAAKNDAASAILSADIRLHEAKLAKDETVLPKVAKEVKANEKIMSSKDTWVIRDRTRILLSAAKAEIKEGELFPCWSEVMPVLDLEGKEIKLADFKGKVVLIDFWAVWCGPCIGEMPNVVKAYETYKDKGFDVIGISFDQRSGEKRVRDTIAGKGPQGERTGVMPWREVYDGGHWDSGFARRYQIRGIPHSVLIDKDGKVIAQKLRGKALQDKLAELLGSDSGAPEKSN